MASGSLRGEVTSRWEEAGRPAWSSAETLKVAEQVDDALQQRDLNPAPRFREARISGDRFYLKTWIVGCRFVWLKGSPETGLGSNVAPAPARHDAQGVNRRLTDGELTNANSLLD